LSEQTGSFRKGPRAGERAPDGQLLNPSGQPTSLFARFRTPDFRLLIFQGRRRAADTKALVSIGQRVLAATGGLVIPTVITTDNPTSPGYEAYVLSDPGQRTHVAYGASTPSLYLIRPDGYVGIRCHAGEKAELVNYLQRHYGIVGSTRAEALDACFC
jgi:4,5-epoxidase